MLKEGELFTAAVEHLRKEVAWVLSNVSQGSAKQVKYLINQGCIPILFDMLSIESDARRACLVLLGIENVSVYHYCHAMSYSLANLQLVYLYRC